MSRNSFTVLSYVFRYSFTVFRYNKCKRHLAVSDVGDATCYTESFMREMKRREKAGEPLDDFKLASCQMYFTVETC